MIIERKWAMPNKNTFDIKPIYDLIKEEIDDGMWIDPFANKNKIAKKTVVVLVKSKKRNFKNSKNWS